MDGWRERGREKDGTIGKGEELGAPGAEAEAAAAATGGPMCRE